MKIILSIITIILISGCKSENKIEKNLTTKRQEAISEIPKVNEQFQIFINQFPEIKLPIRIKGCEDDFRAVKELKKEISLPYENEPYYVFGRIQTNGFYIATITLGAADCFLPILTTYKLNGEKIDSETLGIGLCGSGPCFECEELMEIDNKLNLYVAFESRYFECDENGKEIVGTERKETIYRKGHINKDGVIELTNELKK